MALRRDTDLSSHNLAQQSQSYFDFVVAERPVYIPNSGPPLAPISIMLPHDKKGEIVGEQVFSDKSWVYVVLPNEKNPYLRLAVKPQNIMKYVSPRTYEEFMQKESDRREAKIRETQLRQMPSAKLGKAKSKASKKKGKWGRKKRKNRFAEKPNHKKRRRDSAAGSVSALGPTRKRQTQVEEPTLFPSPTTSHKSRDPSIVKPMGLKMIPPLNEEDEDEDEDGDEDGIEDTLPGQLDELSQASQPQTPVVQKALSKSRSITPQHEPTPLQAKNNHTFYVNKYTTATGSSREAFQRLELLQQKEEESRLRVASNPSTIAQKYSHLMQSERGVTMFSLSSKFEPPPKAFGRKQVEEEDLGEEQADELDEEELQTEWEVAYIKGQKPMVDNEGIKCLHYLIHWVGDWDDSWEPYYNVGDEAVANWRIKKHHSSKSRHSIGTSAEKANNSKGTGKGKERALIDETSENNQMNRHRLSWGASNIIDLDDDISTLDQSVKRQSFGMVTGNAEREKWKESRLIDLTDTTTEDESDSDLLLRGAKR